MQASARVTGLGIQESQKSQANDRRQKQDENEVETEQNQDVPAGWCQRTRFWRRCRKQNGQAREQQGRHVTCAEHKP